ncbi:MAG: hypothetical protein LBM20_03995 [Rikenellaceae bacterium]|jgi:hypothetical protein|nr:hypothetical protein [Rikenellaceae bacterium]
MKRVCNLLFLLLLISCNEKDSEFKLQKFFSTAWDESYCVTEKDCFFFVADKDRFDLTLLYSHENEAKQILDSMDYADIQHSSLLYSFQSEQDRSCVVLWKIEHEFYPTFKAFYLKDGQCVKIGDWGVYKPCETCDTYDYPIEAIRIDRKNERIEISFLEDVEFVDYSHDSSNDKWTTFTAGTLKLSF